jgi:hypothetical protein
MQPYMNLGGRSGVIGYGCEPDSIAVQFSDGSVYLYNYASCGASDCEQLKALAHSGQGLNSYINRYVRHRYASKLR